MGWVTATGAFLHLLALVLLASPARARVASLDLYPDLAHSPFELGVASAEPKPDSVLIWTRCQREASPSEFTQDQNLTWSIWKKSNSSIRISGEVVARKKNDFTVTVEVTELEPDTFYYYEFVHVATGNVSARGRTRTAPSPNSKQPINIATMSCSSIWSGYMNAYDRLAEIDDLNLIAHVGDYIYPELDKNACQRVPSGLDRRCRDECIGEEMDPEQNVNISRLMAAHNCENSDLEQYRWVYRYYLHDPQLRAVRQNHPFIAIFDNHEMDGSRSQDIMSDGIRAFIEYVPIRFRVVSSNGTKAEFYRELSFGHTFKLIALDTRGVGVGIPGDGTYLGRNQSQWVADTLSNSTDFTWRVILTTTPFSPWAVNGWDAFMNSIFAGVFVALILLTASCAYAFYHVRSKNYHPIRKEPEVHVEEQQLPQSEDDEQLHEEISPMINQRRIRLLKGLKCCTIYCGISLGLLIIIWIVSIVLAHRIIETRHIVVKATGDNSLQLAVSRDRHWDGNPDSRRDLLKLMRKANTTKNNIWVSGDLHMSLASDVRDIDHHDVSTLTTADRFGVEILSSSVSRSNVNEMLKSFVPKAAIPLIVKTVQDFMRKANPHFRYYDVVAHGYGLLKFTQDKVIAQYWHTPVLEKTRQQKLANELECLYGENMWRKPR